MPKMLATKKQRYNGKDISKDDIFDVRNKDVRLLIALKRASSMADVPTMTAENTSALVPNPVRESAVVSTPAATRTIETAVVSSTPAVESAVVSSTPPANQVEDENTLIETDATMVQPITEYSKMLREKARGLGLRVDYRWSDERIQREIDEHNKKTYQRMDMRSE